MIIPGIFEKSIEEVINKIKLVEKDTEQIQVDIADGNLVNGKTFLDVTVLNQIETEAELEVHFMVENPQSMVNYLPENVHFACAQVETSEESVWGFIKAAREKGIYVGISINPETQLEQYKQFLEHVDYVQFMTVVPGAQGRNFEKKVLKKIKDFRNNYPHKTTQVDGSINETTLEAVDMLGVDKKVIGSAIFNAKNPEKAEQALEKEDEQLQEEYPKERVKFERLKNRVAFLGGASYEPDDETFKEAFAVAKALAEAGFEIVNGGGPGVMRAATLGALAGGQEEVLVVTYHPSHVKKNYEGNDPNNPYDDEILTLDYFDRTKVMLQNCDIHIVFRGGTGTISEFGMTWASSRIHEGNHKPIVVYGEFWNDIIEVFKKHMLMREGEVELLTVCTTPKEVVDFVKSCPLPN